MRKKYDMKRINLLMNFLFIYQARERRLAAAKNRSISADSSISRVENGNLENRNSPVTKVNNGFVDEIMERIRQCKSQMDLPEKNNQDEQIEEW